MKSKLIKDERGIAEIVSVLLITAIAIVMSASMIQLTQHVSEEIAGSINEYSAVVSVSGDGIRIVNPTITPIEISRIKLIVDSQPAEIKDDNGNGIWEPAEAITLRIEDRNGDGIIPVTLLVDGREVFYTVYAKPITLHSDERFPSISLNVTAFHGKLRIEISSQDDSVVSTYKVQLGDAHNRITPWKVKGVIEPKDIDDLVKELKHFEEKGKKGYLMEKYSEFHDTVEIPASVLADKAYVIVYVKDVTGKTSSKVVELYKYYPQLTNVSVRITSPKNGEEFWEGDIIPIKAVVTGENVASVVIKVDGKEVLKKKITSNPFYVNTEVNLKPGKHTITVEAWDPFGKANDNVTITVKDDKPPSVKVSVDSNIAGKRTITANAQDDRGVTKVAFYVDGKKIAVDSSRPYLVYWKFSAGVHRIKAVAYDNAGQTGIDEITVNFAALDNPPTVKITYPPNGAKLNPGTLTIRADASDDRGISAVAFYVNGKLVGVSKSKPYTAKATVLSIVDRDVYVTINDPRHWLHDRGTYYEASSVGKGKRPEIRFSLPELESGGSLTFRYYKSGGWNKLYLYGSKDGINYIRLWSSAAWGGGTYTAKVNIPAGYTHLKFVLVDGDLGFERLRLYKDMTLSSVSIPQTITAIAYDTAMQTAQDSVTVYVYVTERIHLKSSPISSTGGGSGGNTGSGSSSGGSGSVSVSGGSGINSGGGSSGSGSGDNGPGGYSIQRIVQISLKPIPIPTPPKNDEFKLLDVIVGTVVTGVIGWAAIATTLAAKIGIPGAASASRRTWETLDRLTAYPVHRLLGPRGWGTEVHNAGEYVNSRISSALRSNPVTRPVYSAIRSVRSAFASATRNLHLGNRAVRTMNTVGEYVKRGVTAASRAASSLSRRVSSTVSSVKRSVSSAVSSVRRSVSKGLSAAKTTVSRAVSTIAKSVSSAVRSVTRSISSWFRRSSSGYTSSRSRTYSFSSRSYSSRSYTSRRSYSSRSHSSSRSSWSSRISRTFRSVSRRVRSFFSRVRSFFRW